MRKQTNPMTKKNNQKKAATETVCGNQSRKDPFSTLPYDVHVYSTALHLKAPRAS